MPYQKQSNEVLIAPKSAGWNAVLAAPYTAGAVRFTIDSITIGGGVSWQSDFVAVGDATLTDGTVIPGTTIPGSAATPANVNADLTAAALPIVQAIPNIQIIG